MRTLASLGAVVAALAVVPPVLGPGAAVAQEMQPPSGMMMAAVQGVVTQIRYVSCGSTPDTCRAILQIAPAAQGMTGPQGTMAPQPGRMGESMMGPHPVTVIIVPGTALVWQNSPIPLTRLKVGDSIACEYQTLGDMNVVTKVTLMGMGHM